VLITYLFSHIVLNIHSSYLFVCDYCNQKKKKKVKWSLYRPGVAQRVGRGIALLFHDCGTRRRWVVSSRPRPHFTPGKDPVPIVQEAGWAPGPVRTGGKSRPHRDPIPDRPARSSVVIPTELPGPHSNTQVNKKNTGNIVLLTTKKVKCTQRFHYFST